MSTVKLAVLLAVVAIASGLQVSSSRQASKLLTKSRIHLAVLKGKAASDDVVSKISLGTAEFLNQIVADFKNDEKNKRVFASLDDAAIAFVQGGNTSQSNSAWNFALDKLGAAFDSSLEKSGQNAWSALKSKIFDATQKFSANKAAATAQLSQLGWLNQNGGNITESIVQHMKAVAGIMSGSKDGKLLDMSAEGVARARRSTCAMRRATRTVIVGPKVKDLKLKLKCKLVKSKGKGKGKGKKQGRKTLSKSRAARPKGGKAAEEPTSTGSGEAPKNLLEEPEIAEEVTLSGDETAFIQVESSTAKPKKAVEKKATNKNGGLKGMKARLEQRRKEKCRTLNKSVRQVLEKFVSYGMTYLQNKAYPVLPDMVADLGSAATSDPEVKAMIEDAVEAFNARRVFVEAGRIRGCGGLGRATQGKAKNGKNAGKGGKKGGQKGKKGGQKGKRAGKGKF